MYMASNIKQQHSGETVEKKIQNNLQNTFRQKKHQYLYLKAENVKLSFVSIWYNVIKDCNQQHKTG